VRTLECGRPESSWAATPDGRPWPRGHRCSGSLVWARAGRRFPEGACLGALPPTEPGSTGDWSAACLEIRALVARYRGLLPARRPASAVQQRICGPDGPSRGLPAPFCPGLWPFQEAHGIDGSGGFFSSPVLIDPAALLVQRAWRHLPLAWRCSSAVIGLGNLCCRPQRRIE